MFPPYIEHFTPHLVTAKGWMYTCDKCGEIEICNLGKRDNIMQTLDECHRHMSTDHNQQNYCKLPQRHPVQ